MEVIIGFWISGITYWIYLSTVRDCSLSGITRYNNMGLSIGWMRVTELMAEWMERNFDWGFRLCARVWKGVRVEFWIF